MKSDTWYPDESPLTVADGPRSTRCGRFLGVIISTAPSRRTWFGAECHVRFRRRLCDLPGDHTARLYRPVRSLEPSCYPSLSFSPEPISAVEDPRCCQDTTTGVQ